MSAPVVFLDVDGVLNSRDWSERRAAERPDLTWADCYNADEGVDPRAVARLNRLVASAGAEIVVSSTWRKFFAVADLEALLRRRGLEHPLLAFTPVIWQSDPEVHRSSGRGLEIADWLRRHPRDRFVILDDDADMGELLPKLVKTDGAHGLTDADVDRALRVLGVAP